VENQAGQTNLFFGSATINGIFRICSTKVRGSGDESPPLWTSGKAKVGGLVPPEAEAIFVN